MLDPGAERPYMWNFYYVNWYVFALSGLLPFTERNPSFVDRDIYMRYRGGGVGHFPTRVEEPPVPAEVITETEENDSNEMSGDSTGNGDEDEEDRRNEEEDGDESSDDEDMLDDEAEAEGQGDEGLEPFEEDGEDDENVDIELHGALVREALVDDLGFSEL